MFLKALDVVIPYDEVEDVVVLDKVPSPMRRTFGRSITQALQGRFQSEEWGELYLVIDGKATERPILLIRTAERQYLVNPAGPARPLG